jgi:hypothetical protein
MAVLALPHECRRVEQVSGGGKDRKAVDLRLPECHSIVDRRSRIDMILRWF